MPYDTRQHMQKMIDLLLETYPEGLATSEIASVLGVTTQTVRNYIDRLSAEGVPICEAEEKRGYTVNPRDYLRPLRLSLPQAWFLYLSLRRIVRANLNRYPLVNNLLHRIAAALQSEIAERLVSPDTLVEQQPDTILTALVEAWKTETCVQIQYRPPDVTYASTLTVAPWWFEPAVWSDSNYLIGGLKQGDDYRPITLKLDRIQSVKNLDMRFQRPLAEDLLQRISQTWGIWTGEGVPVRVVLRFHNRRLDRLRETRWHPTEEIKMDAEGYVLWSAFISEPQEMLPWIRGWGADVEVIEPPHIREQVAAEAERTARLYGKCKGEKRSFF